jgi:dihydrofolate synthase / folylpolyglutamate synthase
VTTPGSTESFGYQQAERYLRSLELFGMRFGLERMRRLMIALDSPQERLAAVHVVGTNGKSSTARMIAALLHAHGLRTGAYISPHIDSFAERIEIDGQPLSRARFAAAVQRAAQAVQLVDRGLDEGDRVTQFEALTAAAYWELGRARVDAAVVEAGLGGRYDATSVIASRMLVLTNVGLEHTRWLGPTEHHIAEEKLAVVPGDGTLVAGPLSDEALAVAESVSGQRGASLLLSGRDFKLDEEVESSFSVVTPAARYTGIELRALGGFQRANFALAVMAAESFLGRLEPEAVRTAARDLRLPGRLEPVAERPLVLLDGAHNPSAVRAVLPSLESLVGDRRLIAVLAVLDDKDAAGMLELLLPACDAVVFTRSSHPRALSPATLESLCGQLSGPPSEVVAEPEAALERARALAGEDGVVLVAGSIYLLSDLSRRRADGASEVA